MKRRIAFFTTLLLGLLALANGAENVAGTSGPAPLYDVVVYGDSSGTVVAAVAAQREGRSVILLNPTRFPGGMSSSGLGATDFLGKRGTFGGIASEFYDGIAAAYGTDLVRSFEPHVGRRVFEKMIADVGVTVVYNEKLDRTSGKGVKMNGRRIESLTTLSGKTYRGKMFIDATCAGDLLRNFDAGDDRLPALIEPLAGPGSKVDWNNMHAVGSDHPGANWNYPEAGYEKRREIEKEHETYICGLLWTMANNPRVPEAIRKKTAAYGLPKDEFTDNGG